MTNKRVPQAQQRDLFGVIPKFSMTDPATCMSSIFRPVKSKGIREKGLIVTHEFNGTKLQFRGAEALDSRDQDVLFACCALAAMSKKFLSDSSRGVKGKKLWSDLEVDAKVSTEALLDMTLEAAVFDTTIYQLLKSLDRSLGKGEYQSLHDSLIRLASTSCFIQHDGYTCSMRFLSFASAPDGKLTIAINPRFTAAFAGHHIKQSLVERQQLRSDIARLLHAYLCARLREGSSFDFSLTLLTKFLWPEVSKQIETQRTRMKKVRAVLLDEIASLEGWVVELSGRGVNTKAAIKRARIDRASETV